MSKDNVWVEVEFEEVLETTAAARKLKINGKGVWIPNSQVDEEESDLEKGLIVIREWIAIDRGLV